MEEDNRLGDGYLKQMDQVNGETRDRVLLRLPVLVRVLGCLLDWGNLVAMDMAIVA